MNYTNLRAQSEKRLNQLRKTAKDFDIEINDIWFSATKDNYRAQYIIKVQGMKPLMGFDGKPFVPKGEFCLAYASMPEIKKFLTHYAHN